MWLSTSAKVGNELNLFFVFFGSTWSPSLGVNGECVCLKKRFEKPGEVLKMEEYYVYLFDADLQTWEYVPTSCLSGGKLIVSYFYLFDQMEPWAGEDA